MNGRSASMALALLLACGTAQAADWTSIDNSADEKTELLVDVSSIRVTGDTRRQQKGLLSVLSATAAFMRGFACPNRLTHQELMPSR